MNFDQAFLDLIGHEGGLSMDPKDPGNWTGGKIGVGELKGTKYGVSAKTYPTLDIANLTIDVAKALAKKEYWDKYSCDQFSFPIAFQIFDAAYNGGHPAQWLQQAAGVQVDGSIGAKTVGAVRSTDPDKIVMRFDAYRLKYMVECNNWDSASRGWARRIANNLLKAAE